MKSSLKSADSFGVGVLRMLLSSLKNREIEKRAQESGLTDEEIVEVLRKEAKKRREAADIYLKSGRNDLGEKELAELNLIKSYLPPEIDLKEIEGAIRKVIDSGTRDFGTVMKEAMKELKGRAEAGTVSEIVRKLIR
ncbi:MAG: GatB/YqeY domain-containing protein [Candidatus Colwellbacteria bacterium]|nr:GatB/YqeY domain-containing protein [Candidatus Colwellbacteria bacterium]